jgi:hypothetical protein
MQYAKALVAGAIAGLGSLSAAITDGHVSPVEWIAVASATLVAAAAVWQIPYYGKYRNPQQ